MRTDNILRNALKRRWGKYYDATEVEGYFASVMQAIAPERKELKDLREMLGKTQHEKEAHRETASELEKRAAKAAEETALKAQEVHRLNEQLVRIQMENARQSEQLSQQAIEVARLQTRADKLSELLAAVEQKNPVDKMLDTELKVKQILEKAKDDKEQLLRESYEKRSRMIAASRAAYYNALQFKQDLADQYHRMEEDLNASIDVLRQSEMLRFTLHQDEEIPVNDVERALSP